MDIRAVLVAVLVLAPFGGAVMCAVLGAQRALRSAIVLTTGAVLILSAVALAPAVPFRLSADSLFGLNLHRVVQAADALLLLIILYYGLKHKRLLIVGLALAQLALVSWLEFFMVKGPLPTERILCDHLSLLMVLIISIVGSIICFQAIPYMHNHEHHYHTPKTRQPRFFFVMLLFLGGMNGLVLFNDLTFVYFFFEITTVCSFLLIGHDRTTIATQNALRALWMNSIGGTAFVLGIIAAYRETGSLQLQSILSAGGGGSGVYLLALALLCLAAFVKSAQFPFQSWLLGAMVAPTPVSALLHSSTMVKVGVYLVLRLAPGFTGTLLSDSVAVFGAFSFLAGAALAVGQSNGKKVLAYSTISNLGLIFACAGLNTAEAVTAAMLLLLFHAVVKAMLFLSVGAIEQHIASRDIEDMRGLYAVMPLTALITVVRGPHDDHAAFRGAAQQVDGHGGGRAEPLRDRDDRARQRADRDLLGALGRDPDERPVRRAVPAGAAAAAHLARAGPALRRFRRAERPGPLDLHAHGRAHDDRRPTARPTPSRRAASRTPTARSRSSRSASSRSSGSWSRGSPSSVPSARASPRPT